MATSPGSEMRADRAQRLLKLSRPDVPLASEMGFLEIRSVSRPVLEDYARRVEDFLEWTKRPQTHVILEASELAAARVGNLLVETKVATWLKRLSDEAIDGLLVLYFDKNYFEGQQAAFGEKLLAAIAFFATRFARLGPGSLPRAQRAVRGWRKLVPPVTRVPMPWLGLMAVVSRIIPENWTAAIALMLAFDCYLRPFELETLKASQIAIAFDPTSLKHQAGLILSPLSGDRPGKTGQWEEAVMIDLDVLRPALAYLKHSVSPNGRLWPFATGVLGGLLRRCSNELGLGEVNASLYSLRHGGASRDLLEKKRSLNDIKVRGRWQSDSSLRRYSKETKLVDILSRVPKPTLALGQRTASHLYARAGRYAPHAAQHLSQ